jgi:AraC-like DNA-binding protein/TolB-like protein
MERSVDPGFIVRAVQLAIKHHERESFSGSDLADQLSLSREQTHRKLKHYTSLSTGKFIRYIRLLKACAYLMERQYSIAEVSFKVGFYSPSYFNKCFKEELGIVPGDLRRYGLTRDLIQHRVFSFYRLPVINRELLAHGILLELPKEKERGTHWVEKEQGLTVVPVITLCLLSIASFLIPYENQNFDAVPEVIGKARIAVIPFTNHTGDSLMNPVGDIASSWISGQLGELDEVKTVPFFTIKQYQPHLGILPGDPQNKPTFREVTGVQYLITGSYYRKGQQLYIDAALIDAYTQELISPLPTLAGPQDSVMQIIENLRLKIAGLLTNLENVRLGKLKPPNYEAYKYYLNGLQELRVGLYPSQALSYFEKATELEPGFVMPQMFLTWFYHGSRRDSVLQLIGKIPNMTAYEKNVYGELYHTHKRNYPEALEVTLSSLEDYPQDYYFNLEAAHLAKSQYKPQLAIDILSKLTDPLGSDEGLLWHYFKIWNYTESLVMLEKYDEALSYLSSIPGQFQTPAVPGLMIFVFIRLGKESWEVEQLIERFARDDERLSAEYYSIAAYEYSLVYDEETSHYFACKASDLLRSLPGNKAELFDLADALYLSNDLDSLRFFLDRKMDEDPENDDIRIYLSLVAAAMGKEAAAERIFQGLGNDNLISWRRHEYEYQSDYLKARIAALLGKEEEAVMLLKNALVKGQLRHHWDFERDIFLKPIFYYPPFQALVNITSSPHQKY